MELQLIKKLYGKRAYEQARRVLQYKTIQRKKNLKKLAIYTKIIAERNNIEINS